MDKNLKVMTKKRITWFIVLSIFIGWLIISLIPLFGLAYGEKLSVIILMAMMFSPAISSLLVRLITKEGFKNMYIRPNFKRNWGNICLFILAVYAVVSKWYNIFFDFPRMFDASLTQLDEMLAMNGPAGATAFHMLIITALQVVFIGPIINIIPTMGEELGWRIFASKLREIYSDRIALVTGAIWGIWHLPAIIMGHNYGTEYLATPWLGVLAMIIFCIVLGIIEGYATIKLKSAIPAAMIHSTLNAGAAIPILVTKGEFNPLIGPAITGLAGGIPFIILAIILFIRIGDKRQ